MSRRRDLTDSQQRWLTHLEACVAQGEAMSVYASRAGLSLGAMYEAARTLRRKGALGPRARPRAGGGRTPASAGDRTFLRVPVEGVRADGPAWRARLPNGVILEGKESLGRELVSLFAAL